MIPKNAYMHGLNGILDMWRKPLNCDGNTTYCLTGLKRYLASLSKDLRPDDFDVNDRIWLLEEHRSFEDIVYYLSDLTHIEYFEDNFSPKYKEHFGNYPQKYKSTLMLADAHRGGINFSVCKEVARCINDDKGKNLPKTELFDQLTKGIKIADLGKKYGIKEHRYPMALLFQRIVDEVYDIRHASRILAKHCVMYWVSNQEDEVLNELGLQRNLPPCGTDRYDYAGFKIAA